MPIKSLSLITLLIALPALVLAGCASTRVRPYTGKAPNTLTAYLVVEGGHSELVLPARQIPGRLAVFRHDFPDARFISFGWGERAYFMARNPTAGETLRAIFPANSALLVSGLSVSPPQAFVSSVKVFPMAVSKPGLKRLSRYIWSYVAPDGNGRPRRLGPGHRTDSAFYASSGTYDLFHTCNTWTLEALKVAGKPVHPGGVILANQVVNQAQALARNGRARRPGGR